VEKGRKMMEKWWNFSLPPPNGRPIVIGLYYIDIINTQRHSFIIARKRLCDCNKVIVISKVREREVN
jgi:hypothetical protein